MKVVQPNNNIKLVEEKQKPKKVLEIVD